MLFSYSGIIRSCRNSYHAYVCCTIGVPCRNPTCCPATLELYGLVGIPIMRTYVVPWGCHVGILLNRNSYMLASYSGIINGTGGSLSRKQHSVFRQKYTKEDPTCCLSSWLSLRTLGWGGGSKICVELLLFSPSSPPTHTPVARYSRYNLIPSAALPACICQPAGCP